MKVPPDSVFSGKEGDLQGEHFVHGDLGEVDMDGPFIEMVVLDFADEDLVASAGVVEPDDAGAFAREPFEFALVDEEVDRRIALVGEDGGDLPALAVAARAARAEDLAGFGAEHQLFGHGSLSVTRRDC